MSLDVLKNTHWLFSARIRCKKAGFDVAMSDMFVFVSAALLCGAPSPSIGI